MKCDAKLREKEALILKEKEDLERTKSFQEKKRIELTHEIE